MLKSRLTPELYDYCLEFGVRETSVLRELRLATEALGKPQQIAPEQGALLAMLVQIANCSDYLEIGMYTGYSTLWVAQALAPTAKITTLDIDDQHLGLAQAHWQRAGVSDRITAIIKPALASLAEFVLQDKLFDIVFIDANKSAYLDYYEQSLNLLRPGGLIIIDNVLMYGQVLEAAPRKKYLRILQELNKRIHADPRVEMCLLPIGDGMTIARKRIINEA